MDSKKYFLSLIQRYGKEYLITGLFGLIPTPLGIVLRSFVYRSILERIGKSVHIHPGVQLFGTRMIRMGDYTRLFRGTYIKTMDSNRVILGNYVTLGPFVSLATCDGEGGDIEIGDSTSLGSYTQVNGPGFVRIGRDCLIASYCTFNAGNHIFSDRSRPIYMQGMTHKGITVEDDCWLGNGVRVLDGVTIGRGSVIGAGAVVTKSIPPYSIAVGVPARVIGQRGHEAPIELYRSA